MEDGIDRYLVGSPSSVVFRKYNRTHAAPWITIYQHDPD
jgi:hypothetical protein